MLKNPQGAGSNYFTPMAQTGNETSAINKINQGVTPTAASLKSNIDMQMNPYDDSVINEINRQAGGDYSVLKTAENQNGALGSNRDMLGANDIDLTRLDQIGQFKNGEFNNAMNNAMTVIPQTQEQDINNNMGVGSFLRGLDMSTKQAPLTAQQYAAQLMGVLPQTGGSQSSGQGSSSSNNGLFSGIGGIMSAASMFSDPRLKENIEPVGVENGHNVYRFNYRGDPDKYIGVMADEVQETHPDAVGESHGYLTVDYNKIGVAFRRDNGRSIQ